MCCFILSRGHLIEIKSGKPWRCKMYFLWPLKAFVPTHFIPATLCFSILYLSLTACCHHLRVILIYALK